MPKLPVITGMRLVRVLSKKLDFVEIRRESSHVSLWRERDNIHVTIPVHQGKELGKGLLSKILKDVGVTADDLRNLL